MRGDVSAGLATSFPESIGLAASFSPDAIYVMARATADETHAKHNNATAHGNYSFLTGLSCKKSFLSFLEKVVALVSILFLSCFLK